MNPFTRHCIDVKDDLTINNDTNFIKYLLQLLMMLVWKVVCLIG